jgi:hypothetical protein
VPGVLESWGTCLGNECGGSKSGAGLVWEGNTYLAGMCGLHQYRRRAAYRHNPFETPVWRAVVSSDSTKEVHFKN